MSFPSHYVKVRREVNQSVTVRTWTVVSWDTEIFDTDGAWAIGDPTKIYVPSGVSYARIACQIGFTTNAYGGGVWFNVYLNTTNIIKNANMNINVYTYGGHNFSETGWIAVSPGDEITVQVYYDIPFSSLSLSGTSHTPSFLAVEFM